MQTRKRAKTVTFGKPKEHHTPKEEVKVEETHKLEEVSPKESAPEPTYAAKKVMEEEKIEEIKDVKPEEEPVEKKKEEDAEAPKIPEETTKAADVLTPADQFLSDTNPAASSTSTTSDTPEVIVPKEETSSAAPMVVEPVTTSPTTEDASVPTIPDQKPAESGLSSELSPTPPSSAFSIQDNNVVASAPEGKKKNFVLYFIMVAFISFALGLGAMAAVSYFGLLPKNMSNLAVNPNVLNKMNPLQPTPTSIPTSVPTATPTEKPLDLKAFSVSVLNGSGVVGKAAEVKTSLTQAGFKVTTTGNADRSDYTTTKISAKKSVDAAFLDKLQTELKKTYTLDAVSTADASQTTDVVVTLGKTTSK